VSLKMMAQAMNDTKSTDTEKLIAYFEKETQFDILKARKGYFRDWDHQMMQEQYTVRLKPKAQVKDKWDILALGPAVPGPNEPLESVATTRQENACTL
jgi:branched-chain amino acid transport system substrate-binding protein